MKSRKVINYILIILFLIFIGYYACLFLFTKDSVSTENEKRELSELPEISPENYPNITKEFTAYLKDYIPYRQKVTQLYNDTMVNVFNISNEDAVIIGKDNWLFYNSNAKESNTNEIIDYNGSEIFTEEQMERIAREIRGADAFCKEHGAQMVFLIAPNKSSVYPQNMPSSYVKVNDVTRIDLLYDYLCENTDAIIIYPKQELMKLSEDYKVYFANDTHWNGLGGYFASLLIAKELGIEYPKLDDMELISQSSAEDLKLMLGVSYYSEDIGNLTPDFGKMCKMYKLEKLEHIEYFETDNKNGKRMLLLGDSFSEALVPALGITVEYFDVSRSRYYKFAENKEYDYVVYELVERSMAILANQEE